MIRGSILITVPLIAALAGCSEVPSAPAQDEALAPAFHLGGRAILMLDTCDPASFNAVLGPGTCVNRNGGLTFDKFVAQLQQQQQVPSWRFSPGVIHVTATTTLDVRNGGGEAHTFTEVAEFGGGFLAFLNGISGNPVPAPECVDPANPNVPNANVVFIESGDHDHVTFEPGVAKKYMCCIHPWMRAVSM